MITAFLVAFFIFSAGGTWAAEIAGANPPVVIACIETGNASQAVTLHAEAIAARIYEGIGVHIDWRRRARDCNASIEKTFHIEFITRLPDRKYPGALASTPLGSTPPRIDVYYDRIEQMTEPRVMPILLGHVLAHEIAHLLEGLNRHSEQGIMKAHWDPADYEEMSVRPLSFAPEDVALIQNRLGVNAMMLAQRPKR
ncbi:MAG: hypothetical protein JO307_30410 [Bryobacterales bacterium]|nr:hypothetical protein [Bryobacterales bacterium]MBV9401783.1 hypothetical protein [Bryobacterales bacterium]